VITARQDRSTTRFIVKSYEMPEPNWKLEGESAEIGRPAVRLWWAAGRYVVEYASRVRGADGEEKGFRLYLDLDSIERDTRVTE
jgi:hypothetical protein